MKHPPSEAYAFVIDDPASEAKEYALLTMNGVAMYFGTEERAMEFFEEVKPDFKYNYPPIPGAIRLVRYKADTDRIVWDPKELEESKDE
jgi:hypothetical protein